MSNKWINSRYWCRISVLMVLGALSFAFLAFYSFHTSPFAAIDNGEDSAFFLLVGQGMVNGYIPYKNFYDMKGPILFFIEYIGQVLCYGRIGVFLVQWINLLTALLLICKLFELYGIYGTLKHTLLTLPILFVASFTFEGGNLTEEFSLVPILLCLYIGVLYLKNNDKTEFQTIKFYGLAGLLFGLCFCILVMIRITNAALICAIVFTILVFWGREKKFKAIGISACMFIIGIIIVLIPIMLYYSTNNALNEMVDAMFVLGSKYSGEASVWQHLRDSLKNFKTLLVIIPGIITAFFNKEDWRTSLLAISGTLATFAAISSGNNYTHYYTLAIPLIVLEEISFVNGIKRSSKFTTLLIVALVLSQIRYSIYYTNEAYKHLFCKYLYNNASVVKDISGRIPDEDKKSVYCYNVSPAWYTYAELFPCIKYCGWQNHYIKLVPQIYNDLLITFNESPPKWLVLPKEYGELPDFIEGRLGKEYSLYYMNESYNLFVYLQR